MRTLWRHSVMALALTAGLARVDDDVAAFSKGKSLQVVSSFGEGGLYSVLSRLTAEQREISHTSPAVLTHVRALVKVGN